MGAITEVVRRYVPASYRAMIEITSSGPQYFTLPELQSLADYVQFKLLATIAGATNEASTYDPLLTEFLGKVTTLKFIPAAIDYWGDQHLQVTMTGTNETENFPDRRDGLWRIFAELDLDVKAEFFELAPVYGFRIRGVKQFIPAISYGDNGRGVLITTDPHRWPKLGRRGPWDFAGGPADPFPWEFAPDDPFPGEFV